MSAILLQAKDGLQSSAMHQCDSCPDVTWGEPWELGSAAFWAHLATQRTVASHRLGDDLAQEVVACILGGAGVPGDVGVAAFEHLRTCGALSTATGAERLEILLSEPLRVPGRPRPVRYRFFRQRARRVAAALDYLKEVAGDSRRDPRLCDKPREMRDRLLAVPGVGPKTASWVVRNQLDSDDVAIIDIHVARAGVAAGVFCRRWTLPHNYDLFEAAFLAWAIAGRARASVLDAVVWRSMADWGPLVDVLGAGRRATLTPSASRLGAPA